MVEDGKWGGGMKENEVVEWRKMKKNEEILHFFEFTPTFWEFKAVILHRIWKWTH